MSYYGKSVENIIGEESAKMLEKVFHADIDDLPIEERWHYCDYLTVDEKGEFGCIKCWLEDKCRYCPALR